VKKHSEPGDCWVIIDGKVYDVSQFALSHPGGAEIIFRVAGTDATQEFLDIHPPEYAWEYVGPAIGAVLQHTSPSSGMMSRAGLSVKLAEAESFAELREALQSRILTITGGFGAMVQRYMREQVVHNIAPHLHTTNSSKVVISRDMRPQSPSSACRLSQEIHLQTAAPSVPV
jgi:predicted heme/steroid binding protein